MPINVGDKVHIVERRFFENDVRRHFVGEIDGIGEGFATAEGWAFVFDQGLGTYRRHPERRRRVVSLVDSRLVINLIPTEVEVESLRYEMSVESGLRVTDGSSFTLAVNEFGFNR